MLKFFISQNHTHISLADQSAAEKITDNFFSACMQRFMRT
jgi:hypothetical protein